MLTLQEYEQLLMFAKTKFKNNYKDIVQDVYLEDLSLEQSKKRITEHNRTYFTCNQIDLTINIENQVCTKCNIIKPICEFRIYKQKQFIKARRECKKCETKRFYEYLKHRASSEVKCKRRKNNNNHKIKRYKTDKEYRQKIIEKQKIYHNREDVKLKRKEQKKEWRKNNKEKIKEYNKRYREKRKTNKEQKES